jgi:cation-transporting ATPase 13A1
VVVKDTNQSNPAEVKSFASNLIGDPIEVAAMKAIDWSWDGATSTATPDGAYKRNLCGIQVARMQLQRLQNLSDEVRAPNHAEEVKKTETEIRLLEEKAEESKHKASTALYNSVQVVQRHHFSSALQRMSVVVKCSKRTNRSDTSSHPQSSSSSADHWYCLVKGSPEALKALIVPSFLPSWYSDTYERLARSGLRVLALAYKKVSVKDRPHDQPRAWIESDLMFGGFIAFECKIRADSGVVIQSLIQSDHKVAMLTGDALLTSLHVAKHVHICDHSKHNLTLNVLKPASSSLKSITGYKLYWKLIDKKTEKNSTLEFKVDEIPKLGHEYNLLTTEEDFLCAVECTGGKSSPMWLYAQNFKVFSRMSPQGKASIIRAIQDANKDHYVFMCGDGGNDVGALKQVAIAVALYCSRTRFYRMFCTGECRISFAGWPCKCKYLRRSVFRSHRHRRRNNRRQHYC